MLATRLAALRVAILTVCTVFALCAGAGAESVEEQLWQHRNLGKAFYENPVTQYEAVGEFAKALELAPESARERLNHGLSLLRAGKEAEGIAEIEKAQEQDPSIPHTWFNLGIAYKRQGDVARAITQLEGMLALVEDDPVAHYNLGVCYKLSDEPELALAQLERAAALDPNFAAPVFQLFNAYRGVGRAEDSKAAMALFREIKARNAGSAVPEDPEWSRYSEIYDPLEGEDPGTAQAIADLELDAVELAKGIGDGACGILGLDADGDEEADLVAWSAAGILVFLGGKEQADCGLGELREVTDVAGGDLDNDGYVDLAVLAGGEVRLYRNHVGTYEGVELELPGGPFSALAWIDYDHDYDLDLFLLGKKPRLWRNIGGLEFDDRTSDFPFAPGVPVAAARFDVIGESQAADLVVTYEDAPSVLYRDWLAGIYLAEPLPALPQGAGTLVARDLDHDGWTDLLASSGGKTTLLVNDARGGFVAEALEHALPSAVADLDNRGEVRLVTADMLAPALGAEVAAGLRAALPMDLDADGLCDLAVITAAGALVRLDNHTESKGRWLRVRLKGVKNLHLTPGAEVEVKAGRCYQKQSYQGVPLGFGLGARKQVDTVRITWPNGLIQNQPRVESNQTVEFKEEQRLSGSCPMIFTWNGSEFEFITDVLGVAPLGASAGDGEYFPVDHDEYIRIPGEALVARDGHYELRITEELREVAFLDEIRLIVVDHPEELDVFTNDKFQAPPFPELRLYGVGTKVHPVAARDTDGNDVTAELLALDRTYPTGFPRAYDGTADLHHLDLDFGEGSPTEALLVLSGWVDWADGSTFLGTSQAPGRGLILPRLQVEGADGEWRTVLEDMGIPAGKPKTIVVELAGILPEGYRRLRIQTNLCVYWDEIFLTPDVAAPEVRLTELHSRDVDLRFRGFSGVVIHPQRLQPEHFVYAERRALSMWNPTPGLYTRYGDVHDLLGATDDRFVIMGSGDEVRLLFDASDVPELPAGSSRDFLLMVDGWAKDGDANTAHSQSVEPLPFHAMPQYPYEAPDAYPTDPLHQLYRELYNTRPALRLIRSLSE